MSARAVDSMRSTGLTLRRQTRNIRHACLFLDTGALGAVFTKETPNYPATLPLPLATGSGTRHRITGDPAVPCRE